MNEEQRWDYPSDIILENGEAKRQLTEAVYPSKPIPEEVAEGDVRWNLVRGERIQTTPIE